MENRCLSASHQVCAMYNKGKLLINGKIYEKEVSPTTCQDVLLMDNETEAEYAKKPLHSRKERAVNGSSFQVFMVEAKSLDNVKQAYARIKCSHIIATHIMCGYRILEVDSTCCRIILMTVNLEVEEQFLIKNFKVWKVAVYVVRYHNGPNLGKQ